jgi:hypothetical protein
MDHVLFVMDEQAPVVNVDSVVLTKFRDDVTDASVLL